MLRLTDRNHSPIVPNMSDRNVFITGAAGTGKSFLTQKGIDNWRNTRGTNSLIVTATTGLAALHYPGGRTIHRALNLGIHGNFEKIVYSPKFKNETKWHLRMARLIIIDEISMLRSDTLELIDKVLQFARQNKSVFGGLRAVFVGDFLQLPPVVKRHENFRNGSEFAFNSPVWDALDFEVKNLLELKRQTDRDFMIALNKIRTGIIDYETRQLIAGTRDNKFPDGIKAVKLAATRAEVAVINNRELGLIGRPVERFEARMSGDPKALEELTRDCPAEVDLILKPGAQVMITKNDTESNMYVNGSMGKYVGQFGDALRVELFDGGEVEIEQNTWTHEKTDPKTKEVEVLASLVQYPVKLGYAITLHKSQGQSLDYLEVDLANCFAPGMAYVGLSRARTLAGLKVKNFFPSAVKTNRHCIEFYKGLS